PNTSLYGEGATGIELTGAQGARAYHNTIIVSGQEAVGVWLSSSVRVFNNLLSTGVSNRDGSSMTADSNLEGGTAADLAVPGQPRLAPGSRAIGAGAADDDVIRAVPDDIGGHPRSPPLDVGAAQSGTN